MRVLRVTFRRSLNHLLLSIILLTSINKSQSLVKVVDVNSVGLAYETLFSDFGFAAGGVVSFEIALDVSSSPLDIPSYIVVIGKNAAVKFYDPKLQINSPDSWEAVCSAPSAGRFVVSAVTSFNMTIEAADRYYGYLLLCHEGSKFNGEITISLVNLDAEGNLEQHLSIQYAALPQLYSVLLVAWLLALLTWLVVVFRSRAHVKRIHYFFTLILFLRVLATGFVTMYWFMLRRGPGKQEVLSYVASFIGNASEVLITFTATLISLGWECIRPSLTVQEWHIITVIFMIQSILSGSAALCMSNNYLCGVVSLLNYVLNSLIMLAMVVAINFNLSHIRALLQVSFSPSTALHYLKMKQYIAFRYAFMAFLLLPITILILQFAFLGWEYEWAGIAIEEMFTFVIVVFVGVTFSPFNTWFITRAFDHTFD